MSALVLECRLPGMLTTVQDGGRWGHQGEGMPVAGAMDLQSMRIANLLAGNEENDACLEISLLGPRLTVAGGEGVAAVCGADLGFQLNGAAAPLWTAFPVKEGDALSFSGPRSGCRAYLALSGGIDVPRIMESSSTYTRAKVGGLEGRAAAGVDVDQQRHAGGIDDAARVGEHVLHRGDAEVGHAQRIGGDAAANPWRDLRWPAIPGHFGPPWFLPAIGIYFRLKDKLS